MLRRLTVRPLRVSLRSASAAPTSQRLPPLHCTPSLLLKVVSSVSNGWHSPTPLRLPLISPLTCIATRTASTLTDIKPRNASGSARVLIFDGDGERTIHAMTRAEVLRITEDAADALADPVEETPFRASATPSAFPGRPLRRSNFESIVDVQRVHARDIRQLDSAFAVRSEPSVEVRDQAILINTDPIRAIILRHRCIVFLREDDLTLRPMLEDVFHEVASHSKPNVAYEFQALESLLAALCRYYHGEYDRVAPAISTSLGRLKSDQPTTGEINTLRSFKNTMNEFQSRIDGARRALMATLNNEEDLRLLYLSKLHADRSLLGNIWSFDSEEAEVLIENYLQDIYALQTNATLMQQRIQNTETVVKLRLDAMRNYLLGVNIMFSVAGISLSLGTFTVGVFGMNLISGWEEAPGMFVGITAFSAIVMATTGVMIVRFFRHKGIFGSIQNVNSLIDKNAVDPALKEIEKTKLPPSV